MSNAFNLRVQCDPQYVTLCVPKYVAKAFGQNILGQVVSKTNQQATPKVSQAVEFQAIGCWRWSKFISCLKPFSEKSTIWTGQKNYTSAFALLVNLSRVIMQTANCARSLSSFDQRILSVDYHRRTSIWADSLSISWSNRWSNRWAPTREQFKMSLNSKFYEELLLSSCVQAFARSGRARSVCQSSSSLC